MIRRDFLIKSGLLGGALLVSPAVSCSNISDKKPGNFYTPIRQKVKMAMLSLQKQNWEHGLATQAFVENGDETMMILMAREAVARQEAGGRLAVISTANGINDSATPLEAVLKTAEITGDKSMKEAADYMLEYLFQRAPRTKEGYIHHSYHGPELWADSIYMAPPFVAYAGYPEEGFRQAKAIIDRLWMEEESLFAYRWNADTGQISHPRLWGLANAHAISGMTKLISHLPDSMTAERDLLKRYVELHLEGCLRYLKDDFLFHDTINDPATYTETSLAMRVADTVFKGIKAGWLASDHLETALNIRKAVHTKVDGLGYVLGVPGPPNYSEPVYSSEGQAFFLMMEASYDNLNA